MKLKVKPEDFIVNEKANINFKEGGKFKVYLLTKRDIGTIDALLLLSKKLNIPFKKFGYGGKKDKHALTSQYITVEDLKIPEYKERFLEIKYIGETDRKMGPDLLAGNEFNVTIRDLSESNVNLVSKNIDFVIRYGFPNYFDDQRFRSFSPQQGFFAEKLIKGHFNGALKIYLTTVYPMDKKEDRLRKIFFFKNWGNWEECFSRARTNFEKNAFKMLIKEKSNFLKVLYRIPAEELRIFISSFQAYLWNNLVERLVKSYTDKFTFYKGNHWYYFFYSSENVFTHLKDLFIPLPSAKAEMPNEISERLYNEILKQRDLTSSSFKLKRFRKVYFKSVLRRVIITPQLKSFCFFDDDIYRNKKALFLNFHLPPGSYGTMFIKRLFAEERST